MAAGSNDLISVKEQAFQTSTNARRCIGIAFIALALVPAIRAACFLLCEGVDIPSNDDVIFFQLMDRMEQSDYNWLNYFQDTFINGHCFAVGQALFWLNCLLTGCSQNAMIAAAMLLLTLRLWITNEYLFGKYPLHVKAPTLFALSTLLFAPSQTAVLAHGTFALSWQLSLLANVFTLWIISRWKHSKKAQVLSSLSMVLGCWTTALSVPALPLVFAQVYAAGARRWKEYAWITVACAISLAPYVIAFVLPSNSNAGLSGAINLINYAGFLNILGRPFCNSVGCNFGHMPQAMNAGLAGIVCLAFLALLVWRNTSSKRRGEFLTPAVICTALGLMLSGLVAMVRTFVAPTNCSMSMIFWSGLAAICLYCFTQAQKWVVFTRASAALILAAIIFLNFSCSRKFEDKQYYLDNRAPYCASLLRHYDTAPTYATGMLFKLVNQQPYSLSIPLEKNHWSIFSPHRQLILQGDFVLPTVVTSRRKNGRVYWVKGTNAGATSWKSYQHLNLALQDVCSVEWRLDIPESCSQALLKTNLLKKCSAGESLETLIILKLPNNTESGIGSLETKDGIDLKQFAGQSIIVRFHHSAPGVCLLQYPRLDLIAPPDPSRSKHVYNPANVYSLPSPPCKPQYELKKIDDQRMSIRPPAPLTVQGFRSLDFVSNGKTSIVNCIVKYKSGALATIAVPILRSSSQTIYKQPGRLFDDSQEEIEEVSLVNNGSGVLSDYVASACLRVSE